ncbi:hypothetical protein RB601_002390 [Gaeumannomyces tritici]
MQYSILTYNQSISFCLTFSHPVASPTTVLAMDTDRVVLSPKAVASPGAGEDGPDQVLSRRSALILYGSETGNAQDIAEDLGRTLERLRFRTSVVEMDDVGPKELLQHCLVIFAVSTTGQGDMPQNASKFWRSLLRRKLPPSCLSRLAYTCFGLGDSSYPKYNWAARKLCKRLGQLGALEVFTSGEGDERHDDGIDTVYLPWKGNLRSWILANHPLPGDIQPIPDQEPQTPRFTLLIDESAPKAPASDPIHQQYDKDKAQPSEAPSAALLLPIRGGITATLRSNERVTPADHWQDVRLLRLDLETSPAEPLRPGATVTIYPKNQLSDVDALIERMRWQDQADRPLRFPNGAASLPKGLAWCATTAATTAITLRDLLTHGLDITAVPRRGFLERLSFLASEPDQAERLRELADPAAAHEFYDYTARPRRTILEILRDFPSALVPASSAADVFPIIRGREFSIANGGSSLNPSLSGEAAAATTAPLRVEILAAMVEYRTIIRKPRVGLCSRYLGGLQPGTRITVTLKQGSGMLGTAAAPSSPSNKATSRPVVAVATGTGVAPIRMLLHHMRSAASPPAEALLFFGCRSRRADYYFADEWRAASNGGALTVVPAFSRDPDAALEDAAARTAAQDEPVLATAATATATATTDYDVEAAAARLLLRRQDAGSNYVQHHIRRHATKVADLVTRGAVVCICGSAGAMPRAVRLALEDTLVAAGVCAGPAEAAEHLATKVDVWQETW